MERMVAAKNHKEFPASKVMAPLDIICGFHMLTADEIEDTAQQLADDFGRAKRYWIGVLTNGVIIGNE